jgi:valyl-tRNA synthetase
MRSSRTWASKATASAPSPGLKAVVSALRSIRSQLGIAPARTVPLLLQGGDADDADRLRRHEAALRFLAKLESIEKLEGEAPAASAAVVGGLTLLIPLAGLVDLDAERARLDKELKRIAAEIGKCENKLASDTFVRNAPAAVVEQERARLADWSAQHAALAAQRARL